MGPTIKSMRKANTFYNFLREEIPFYKWWEHIKAQVASPYVFCRFCGLYVELNQMMCVECG